MSELQVNKSEAVEAEITVSSPITAEQFVEYLRANGFVGNTGINPNNPGKVWIGFNNGI